MRATSQFTLPSGTIAELITSWTFGEFEKIEAAASSVSKMVVGDDGTKELMTDAGTAKRVAMLLAVKKLTAADGSDLPVNDETISNMSMTDGVALRKAVDEIGGNEKKG